jgi:hypothetical protein
METRFDSPETGRGAHTADPRTKEPRKSVSAALERVAFVVVLLLATSVFLWLEAPRLREIWLSGSFFDTDDAMRMVQVRDLMAGQGWFDMNAWRLDPPRGVFTHWSRVVDAPLAALILFFRRFLDGVMAEHAARIAFPTLMLLALFAGGAYAARVFAGRSMRLFGVAAMLFCGVMFWQFPPGRIDHHAPQIVTLIFSVAAMAEAYGPARAREAAALSGAMMAVSLAIGFEDLPFQALVAAAPAIYYILRGGEAREALRGFALGLAGALTPLFLLTVGPARWGVVTCDALSYAHLFSVLTGCACYAILAAMGASQTNIWARLGLVAVAACLAVAPLASVSAACLVDPFVGLDPIVRRFWLDHNAEVISLAEEFRIEPSAAVLMAGPILIGLCGALFGCWRTSGVSRGRWVLLSGQIAIGLAFGAMHVRVFSTTMPLAAVGLLAPVSALCNFFARRATGGLGRAASSLAALMALFALSAFGVALAMPDLKTTAEAESSPANAWRRPDPCLASASYEPLAVLPPGLAVSQIPAGSYLLAHTNLSVLAAPYHRNNAGNRAALDILRAPPALAEDLARRASARYILLCWMKPSDGAALREMAPDGLAAELSRGSVPGWLRPLRIDATPFNVYEVMPPNG